MFEDPKRRIPLREVMKIPLLYLAMGFFWIYFSDRLVSGLITDLEVLRIVNTYKGWVYVLVTGMILYFLIARQVEKLREREREILRSESKYWTLIQQMQLGMALYEGKPDSPVDQYVLQEVNDSHGVLMGLEGKDILGKPLGAIFPAMKEENRMKLQDTANSGDPVRFDSYQEKSGKFYETIVFRPREGQLAIIINDTTKRVESEKKLQYMADHDLLTDLYNRHYFDYKLRKTDVPDNLPLTYIVGDINGIKLVNDSFGYATGDEMIRRVADAFRQSCPDEEVFRLGGDEFAVLMTGKGVQEAEDRIQKIKSTISEIRVGALAVSVSFGYRIKSSPEESMAEVIKNAEDAMYSRKTYESPGVRGKTIEAIVTTLHEKNKREEEHSRRVSELCEKIGRAMNLSEDDVKQLRMAGLLHDIGKIGIPETVLNKEGSLATEERQEIQKHPEIGYRILSTVNSLSELAEYVLAHHERIDGMGYPKGLAGDEIPLKACIIGVADAYDAMISYRTYRKSLTKEEAIGELNRCSGTQFHPECVQALIQKVL
jgi:diguanylate cyclase (GGDEF)-like protein/putative nucleotidyltransferase with HDIG domain